MKKWFGCGGIALLLVACTLNDPTPDNTVCLVTELVQYQQKEDNQQEIGRQTFAYRNGQLTSYASTTPNRSISFRFDYVGGKISSAYTEDRSIVLNLDYNTLERVEKASYVVNNKEQSVFSLFYDSVDRTVRLIRLVETRVTLPTNSFIASRTFQFSYATIDRNTVDLVSQSVQNGYKDGSRTVEELTFEQSAENHSPFFDSGQSIVLALLALTNPAETDVARYLQRYDCKSFTRKTMDTSGVVILQESSQFTTNYDLHFNPLQAIELSRLSIPADTLPAVRNYRQTYQYDCIE
jgi:hypothetical protein